MTIAEQILPQFLLTFFEFLRISLIETNWIVIHLGWLFIHLFAGAVLFYLLRKEKYPMLVVFELLILFEVFEFIFSNFIPLILIETFADIVWDLIFGMIGALIVWLIFKE